MANLHATTDLFSRPFDNQDGQRQGPTKSTTVMSVAMFARLPDHPRQRDTERHAAMAKRNHLARSAPTHLRVAVVEFDGRLWKIDGHTRSLLWERGELEAPQFVDVDVYHCDTWDQVLDLYGHFDNKKAAESSVDALSGAFRQHGLEARSALMRQFQISSALTRGVAYVMGQHRASVYDIVGQFKSELQMLDRIEMNRTVFKGGVITGALLVLKRHGDAALPFFVAVNENAGSKSATECDAVQALRDVIAGWVAGSAPQMLKLAAKTVSCSERWLRGQTYTVTKSGVSVKPTDLFRYARTLPGASD